MEKRIWSKPEMHEFAFAANEYVAACGDQNKVYKFICDAAAGPLYYWKKFTQQWQWNENWQGGSFIDVPTDWTKNDGVVDGVPTGDVGKADHLVGWLGGEYHPCSAEHEASVNDDFYDGFVDYDNNQQYDDGEGVIVWRGENGNNGHATKNLNMATWETAKS